MYLHTLLRNNSDGLKEFSTEIEIVNCESKWKWDKHNKLFQKMLSYLNNTVIKACKIRDFITHFTCYIAVFQYFFLNYFDNFCISKFSFRQTSILGRTMSMSTCCYEHWAKNNENQIKYLKKINTLNIFNKLGYLTFLEQPFHSS